MSQIISILNQDMFNVPTEIYNVKKLWLISILQFLLDLLFLKNAACM